jgi:diguanylate cyclase (GGDEF)-like protein
VTRSGIAATVVTLGVVLLLSLVAVKMQSLDFQEHSQYDTRLVHLKELDARQNADVLESRFELAISYDALVADLVNLKLTESELQTAPAFVDAGARVEISQLLASHAQAVDAKAALVERFKTENAILRNSLHYLPVLYSELAPATTVDRAPFGVSEIVRDALLYNLNGDPAIARAVRARVDLMASSSLGDGSPAAYQLRTLAAHVGIILASKPVLDGLVEEIVAVPTRPRAEALEAAYAREYGRALGWANLYRLLLLALAVILLACTVYILVRLRRATVERNAATTALVARQLALQYQAHHDGLTDLPNRTLLHERLEDGVAAARDAGRPMALLIMDLDRFKEVNDTLGHHAGDALLREVAARLRVARRAGDTVARLGGDEFAILLPNATENAARARATRLLADLAQPFIVEERVLEIGASIGIALYPEHGADAETLLRHADVALYVAKRENRGSILYSPEQDLHSATRLGLTGALRRAIETGELVLHYQPIIEHLTRRVSGVEALVRWQHPLQGLLLPDHFIPLAEETGLIDLLSRWVLDAALQQCCAWRRDGLDLPVSVNLSMRNLQDQRLPESIAPLLTTYGVPPGWLTLEITESAVMADPERALGVLGQLRALGVRVAIDDFGTGYSSLAYLKRLPVDQLKIDRSFTLNVCVDRSDLAIVRSVIELGHQLDLQIVAEGVEDEESWKVLLDLGCDEALGYFFSRPLPAAALVRWLGDSTWRPRAADEETRAA